MTNGLTTRFFNRRHGVRIAVLIAAMSVFSGCRTTSLEEIAPTNLVPPPARETTSATAASENDPAEAIADAVPAVDDGPRNTGRYPNINIVPKGETAQISNAERKEKVAELEAAKKEIDAEDGDAESEADKLRRLAREHAKEALDAIKKE